MHAFDYAAPTSVKETWTSPSYTGGPVGSVAVLAVTEQGMIRTGLENRFARELGSTVETVVPTHKYLSLSEIKEDEEAAAARLLEAGVRTVLITRLTSSEEQAHSVRAGNERYAPVTTGYSPASCLSSSVSPLSEIIGCLSRDCNFSPVAMIIIFSRPT